MGLFFSQNTGIVIPSFTNIKYGYLYNAYVVNDSRNVANTDWRMPEGADFLTLISFLFSEQGLKCSEVGTDYSIEFLSYTATNSAKFNARKSSIRDGNAGSFLDNNTEPGWYAWTTTLGLWQQLGYKITYNSDDSIYSTFRMGGSFFADGLSIRLIKDVTTLNDGEEGTYTGNDGTIYRTICIGTQEWVADNLAETKYRNGDIIPNVTDGAEWAALITGALCAYNNDENNVFI